MSEITSDSLNRDLIRQKDAEIERLRADLNEASDWNISYRKLITELCDALEWYGEWFPAKRDLLQRAREATR
jgi:hypothetical protein